jgi:hypothetical protein
MWRLRGAPRPRPALSCENAGRSLLRQAWSSHPRASTTDAHPRPAFVMARASRRRRRASCSARKAKAAALNHAVFLHRSLAAAAGAA